jgi:hypothetical protein
LKFEEDALFGDHDDLVMEILTTEVADDHDMNVEYFLNSLMARRDISVVFAMGQPTTTW